MKSKLPFLKELFYKDSGWLLLALNRLLKEGLVTINDHYGDGDFLFMRVKWNDQSKTILSEVIDDFEGYNGFCRKELISAFRGDEIDMFGLYWIHAQWYPNGDEICWDKNIEYFVHKREFDE